MSTDHERATTRTIPFPRRWRLGKKLPVGELAQVHSITDVRAAQDGPLELPVELWDEMARAADLFEALAGEGKQLRYSQGERQGDVTVSLCDLEGSFLRAVPLIEGLGDFDGPSPAA